MSEENYIPTVIVGGGVIGLAIAYQLIEVGKSDFCILEKEKYIGDHSSGRNSGVMHAGLYYADDSLKKKFSLEGLKLWEQFAKKHDLFHKKCGKYIFAKADEKHRLDELFERALKNGASVRRAFDSEIEEISKYCKAEYGFFSENTAIINPSEAISFLKNYIESKDIPLLLSQDITNVLVRDGKYELTVNGDIISCSNLINACGLGAVNFRKLLGLSDYENTFVKGHYLRYQKKFFNNSLLYPLPLNNLKGLGVHTCIDADGSIKFGPDTEDVDVVNYKINSNYIEKLKEEVTRSFDVDPAFLIEDFAGVRSKVLRNGELVKDFVINSNNGYIELLGIESPGFTSSLAIGRYIAEKIS